MANELLITKKRNQRVSHRNKSGAYIQLERMLTIFFNNNVHTAVTSEKQCHECSLEKGCHGRCYEIPKILKPFYFKLKE